MNSIIKLNILQPNGQLNHTESMTRQGSFIYVELQFPHFKQ